MLFFQNEMLSEQINSTTKPSTTTEKSTELPQTKSKMSAAQMKAMLAKCGKLQDLKVIRMAY